MYLLKKRNNEIICWIHSHLVLTEFVFLVECIQFLNEDGDVKTLKFHPLNIRSYTRAIRSTSFFSLYISSICAWNYFFTSLLKKMSTGILVPYLKTHFAILKLWIPSVFTISLSRSRKNFFFNIPMKYIALPFQFGAIKYKILSSRSIWTFFILEIFLN